MSTLPSRLPEPSCRRRVSHVVIVPAREAATSSRRRRPVCGPPSLLLLALLGASGPAQAAEMVIELTLASLPEDVTLCRTSASWNQTDHFWQVLVDADADAGSGDQGGFELVLQAYTTPQPEFCLPQQATLASALVVDALGWDEQAEAWVVLPDAGVGAWADPPADTLRFTLTGAVLGDFGVHDRSRVVPVAGSSHEGQSGPTFSSDWTEALDLTEQPLVIDPTGDLANCDAGCQAGDPAFAMADLVRARLSSDLPLSPRFGAATATFEVGVAAMPEQVAGCPDGLDLGVPLREYAWAVWIDVDGDPATGLWVSALEGADFVAVMGSPVREPSCQPFDIVLSELEVAFAQWDASLGDLREASMPSRLRVDPSSGTLVLELDRSRGVLQRLGEGSRLGLSTQGVIATGDGGEATIDALEDVLDSPMLFVAPSGQQDADASGDLACSQCDRSGQPALMLDLRGFHAALADPSLLEFRVFDDGFE